MTHWLPLSVRIINVAINQNSYNTMEESRKRASGSEAPSAKKTNVSDEEMLPSDQRVFTLEWKKKTIDYAWATLLTATRAYTGHRDRIIVYDTVTKQEIKEIAPRGGKIWDISQSRDEKSLLVACEDETARVINLFTGNEVILRGHTNRVICIIQGEDTDVLSCSEDKTIRRWNSLTGECLKIYEGHTGCVVSILYDEATKRIFSASEDKTIIVWNSETGEIVGVMEGHRAWVNSLTRVNSTTIASGSNDGSIKLWDTATLACTKTISNGSPVNSIAATRDGQHLISGSDDNKVKVRSVATGRCLHTLSQTTNGVYKVAVSPDGRFIASAGFDNMFRLFSVSPPFSFTIHGGVLINDGRAQSLALLSDGAIRSNSDLTATVTSTSTCALVSDNRIVIHNSDSVELTAPSISSAQLWSEAIGAVAADLALHPDDRAHSADQMVRRYRFNLLQTILVHRRERGTRKWHIPREIVQVIGGYAM